MLNKSRQGGAFAKEGKLFSKSNYRF